MDTLIGIPRGRVLLVFFKVSCPVCQFALPYLNRVDKALAVYGVSQNDDEDTREFAECYGVKFPIVRDSEEEGFRASNAFGISYVPTIFVVEEDFRISQTIEGWSKSDMESLGAVKATDNVPMWKAG